MTKCLIDAGSLIALFDKDDKYHHLIKDFLKTFEGRLITSWPVITEVLHMLDFHVNVQIDFLTWIQRGGLVIAPLSLENLQRIIELSKKYSNVPMDFADATLIMIAETQNIKKIISIDSDFYIYRNIRDEYIENIFSC